MSSVADDRTMSSKNPRRQPDRRRHRTKTTLSDGRVKVSIATAPQMGPDGELDGALAGDVELAKAAVLYADEVEMIGLGVAQLHPLIGKAGAAPFQLLMDLDDEALAEIDARTGKARQFPDGWRDLLRQFNAIDDTQLQRATPELRDQVLSFRAEMEAVSADIQSQIDAVIAPTGLTELMPAITAKVLTVADLGVSASTLYRPSEVTALQNEEQLQRWLAVLLDRLDDRHVRLLFDEASGSLVGSMIDGGIIEANNNSLRLAAQAALGAGFVARLPALTAAPMDELLDLRAGLVVPLTSYRGAIIRFSKGLPEVVGDDLSFEVQQLWEETVQPSIVQLEDELAHHSLVKEMARSLNVSNVIDFGGWTATTAFAVGSASDLGLVVSALVGAGAGGLKNTAQLGIDAVKQRGQARRDAVKSEFYFLYKAKAELGKGP